MATRCHTIIKKGEDKAYVYRHFDGYPEETGNDLKTFMNISKGSFNEWSVNDFATYLGKYNDAYEFENYGIHGDEDYIYFIDMDKKTLECYEVLDEPSEVKENMDFVFKEKF